MNSLRRNSEWNPFTLQFKSHYCAKHKHPKRNMLRNFLCLKSSNNSLSASNRQLTVTTVTTRASHQYETSINDELTETCSTCMSESANFDESLLMSKEKSYTDQPSPLFKYHIFMCFLIFLSIVIVLFINDVKKSRLFYTVIGFGSFVFLFSIILSFLSVSQVSDSFFLRRFLFLLIFVFFCVKYGRNKHFLNSSTSIMSSFRSARYVFSLLAIICCLLLPWSVDWVHATRNVGPSQIRDSVRDNVHQVDVALSKPTNHEYDSDEYAYYLDDNPNFEFYKRPNRTKRALLAQMRIIKRHLSITSNAQIASDEPAPITYFSFELNLLLIHISILACTSFIQLYFLFKLCMMLMCICIYVTALNWYRIFESLIGDSHYNLIFIKVELVFQMFFYLIFLHLIDRRVLFAYNFRF